MITFEQWQKAQVAERRFHNLPESIGFKNYFESYKQYFHWLGIDFNCKGKSILEIGPADYPALAYCSNYTMSYIIEPMASSILKKLIKGKQIVHVNQPAEYFDWNIKVNEVWLFNVLQHVLDPDTIIDKCKKVSEKIYFFEPINCGTNDCHLWDFTLAYFKKHFSDVKHYESNVNAVNFHTHECAYGVWVKK